MKDTAWDMSGDKSADSQAPRFSEDDLMKDLEKEKEDSLIILGVVGDNGTGKSGIVMDCRTPEEIEAGKKVIIFDLDTSNGPLKAKYHNNDKNIIVINPFMYENNKISYLLTHEKILAYCDLIHKKYDPNDIKIVSIDTADTLLEISKNAMKEELGIDYNEKIPIQMWELRNVKYWAVVRNIMRLPCAKAIVTHYKKKMHFKDGVEYETTLEPKWLDGTPDLLYQRLEMSKREEEDEDGTFVTDFVAKVVKSKTNLELEGKEYIVARVKQMKGKTQAKWRGLFKYMEPDL